MSDDFLTVFDRKKHSPDQRTKSLDSMIPISGGNRGPQIDPISELCTFCFSTDTINSDDFEFAVFPPITMIYVNTNSECGNIEQTESSDLTQMRKEMENKYT
jgi:hypothetical protein